MSEAQQPLPPASAATTTTVAAATAAGGGGSAPAATTTTTTTAPTLLAAATTPGPTPVSGGDVAAVVAATGMSTESAAKMVGASSTVQAQAVAAAAAAAAAQAAAAAASGDPSAGMNNAMAAADAASVAVAGDSATATAEDAAIKALKRKERLEQNRISARESRKRKKTMIEELQRTVISLSRENKELHSRNDVIRSQLLEIGQHVRTKSIARRCDGDVGHFCFCKSSSLLINKTRIVVFAITETVSLY